MTTFLGIIPARFASTRFPGKPLIDIKGKTMIQRVYEQASKAINDVVVATDDKRIFEEVKCFGGKVLMTSAEHRSGTDRCYEAFNLYTQEFLGKFDVIINIQGDEPFIEPGQIELLKTCFQDSSVDISTLIKKIEDNEAIFDPNRPKVVINKKGEAMYFSRSPVPYIRGVEKEKWKNGNTFYQHIGMYAYRSKALSEITKMEQSELEKVESLEQLRWLENGLKIKTALTQIDSYGIDTPEDLARLLTMGIL